jgi:oligoendopeptidase F
MTLAESASTFAENVLVEAALDRAEGAALARTLDARLQDAATYLLDIAMRFRFERRFYAERAEGEVGVERLCALMAETQREVWGDVLDPAALDPWFWASKLHFYIAGISFYNFPYTFGYLFSTGLFVRALAEGSAFLPAYEALLRRTGSAPAEQVAREALGVDLERPDFWHASLDWVEGHLERFEAAIADADPGGGLRDGVSATVARPRGRDADA